MRIVADYKKNSFNGALNNKLLRKGLEFAADNGALFAAGTSLALSTVVRPLAILATPKVEKENKQYAFAKSVASSLVGFGIMAAVSSPIVRGVKNISETPNKFLDSKTIKAYKEAGKNLNKSAPFKFVSQIFKLSSAFVTAFPKAFLTCALIPPVMAIFFKAKSEKEKQVQNISFGANIVRPSLYKRFTEKISTGISQILKTNSMQRFAQKYKNSNIAQHMFSANDVLLTGLFVHQTATNKKIKESRKKTLMCNASIMTALTIVCGYAVNKLLDKPTKIFIEKFKAANKKAPKLDKYLEGIKIAKPVLILGGLYYIVAPVVSTALAEIMTKDNQKS